MSRCFLIPTLLVIGLQVTAAKAVGVGDKLVVAQPAAELKAEPSSDSRTIETPTRGKLITVREVNGNWVAYKDVLRLGLFEGVES